MNNDNCPPARMSQLHVVLVSSDVIKNTFATNSGVIILGNIDNDGSNAIKGDCIHGLLYHQCRYFDR